MRALSAAALALPGLAGPAAADSAPTEMRSDYRYSRYSEDNIASDKVAEGGERSRYDIDIHQFRFESGIGNDFGLGIDLTHETMSGATPWYVRPGTNNEPVQVMTEATIDEKRTDALVAGSYYLENGKASLGGGISSENDYFSYNVNVGGERSFNEKNTTISGGIGGSFDSIEPTGTREFPNRVSDENKQSYNLFLALGHVLGRSTLIQTSGKYQFNTGFLSDPYKLALVAGNPENDERPDQRHQFSWLTRFRQHFGRLEGTLHFDYMLYVDDWDMNSHTFELAWYQTLFDRFRIVPSARYYSQSQADFYAPFYATQRSDGLRSSDYRLSPFGAYSYRIEAEVPFETWGYNWEISAAYERYVSGSEIALQKVDVENPGLVSFNLFTVGLTARF